MALFFFPCSCGLSPFGVLSMGSSKDFCGRGCQHRFGIPFWLVGEFTTHFRTYFSWGLRCSLGVRAFDPWPCYFSMSVWSFSIWGPFHGQFQGVLWPWLSKPFWDPILVGRSPPILEPILVGIGMFTGGTCF